ncbi:MAG: hypothetical protein QGD89_09140 [Actinomycetota bacterium]|nr:hypothetical protein [Actinomycetota bacterium]
MRAALTLTLDLAATGLLGYGAWLAWPPAGYMVAGVMCLLFSFKVHKGPSSR